MSKCNHNNFDDYFDKCQDCEALLERVISDNFIDELQSVYKNILDELGIENGDIAPEQAIELNEKEQELSNIVAKWVSNLLRTHKGTTIMKNYTIYFEEAYKIKIEAKTRDEALDKFMDGEYDNAKYLEISGYEIIEDRKLTDWTDSTGIDELKQHIDKLENGDKQ